jgi:hypothetical protein
MYERLHADRSFSHHTSIAQKERGTSMLVEDTSASESSSSTSTTSSFFLRPRMASRCSGSTSVMTCTNHQDSLADYAAQRIASLFNPAAACRGSSRLVPLAALQHQYAVGVVCGFRDCAGISKDTSAYTANGSAYSALRPCRQESVLETRYLRQGEHELTCSSDRFSSLSGFRM